MVQQVSTEETICLFLLADKMPQLNRKPGRHCRADLSGIAGISDWAAGVLKGGQPRDEIQEWLVDLEVQAAKEQIKRHNMSLDGARYEEERCG